MDELERFKRIRLQEYAASVGYAVDKRESSKRELVMRRGGDKISIRLDTDGHYVYYSFRDLADNGTIIDFVGRQEKNFGERRKMLRVWLGEERVVTLPELVPAPRANRSRVQAEFAGMKDLVWHEYLEKERCLPRAVLTGARFKGRIKVGKYANAVFPHYEDGILCGFEIRNWTFKGFSTDGEKGLWLSNQFPQDRRLVVGEGAIDCISYEVLFPGGRYASIAGGMKDVQPELIRKECTSLPLGSEVVCITHADADGERYAEAIREVAEGFAFRIHRPSAKDWNDALRVDPRLHSFPAVQ